VIVGVPQSVLLWPASSSCPSCDSYEALALRVLEERAAGARSAWAPYIDLLPSSVGGALDLSREQLEELRGTYAGAVVSAARVRAARFIGRAKRELPGVYTDEALRWAFGIVLSRSLNVGAPLGGHNGSDARVVYDTPFLAPGADFLDHNPSARVGWTFREAAAPLERQKPTNTIAGAGSSAGASEGPKSERIFSIVSLHSFPRPGMTVSNSYDDGATNAHTLAFYGFVAEVNPADAVVLTLPLLHVHGGSTAGDDGDDVLLRALGDARADWSAQVASLLAAGRMTDPRAQLALALLPPIARGGGSGIAVSNVTIVLHESRKGAPPLMLLNSARLAALNVPSIRTWLDGYAIAYGPRSMRLSEKPSNAEYLGASRANTTASGVVVQLPAGGGVQVLVPASGEEEAATVTDSLRLSALAMAARSLDAVLQLSDARLARHNEAAFFSVEPSTGSVRDLTDVAGGLDLASAALAPSSLLSTVVNASALLDLVSYSLVMRSLRSLLEGYPSSLQADEEALAAVRARTDKLSVLCGLRHASTTSAARLPGAVQRDAAAAVAAAFSTPAASAASPLPYAESVTLGYELRRLMVRASLLTARVGEQRIIGSALARYERAGAEAAARLRRHGILPLVGGAGGSWEADWGGDLPDLSGFLGGHAPPGGDAAATGGDGLRFAGGHVHEEGEALDVGETRAAEEAEAEGPATPHLRGGHAEEHAAVQAGEHVSQRADTLVDRLELHP